MNSQATISLHLEFEDSLLLPGLYGQQEEYLQYIEQELGVVMSSRGTQLVITGNQDAANAAKKALMLMYEQLRAGNSLERGQIDGYIRHYMQEEDGQAEFSSIYIKTPKKQLNARTRGQGEYISMLQARDIVFAGGPAGTGKTYLAVAAAVQRFAGGEVERIILSRPAVEAGESLGFLPGDMRDKVDPYLRPLYDSLNDMLPADKVQKCIASGQIEIAPLAFMRGRTLKHACIILDEAQNTTKMQMKMFLTRLGEGAKMVITGDLSQTDLPEGVESGFRDAMEKLKEIREIGIMQLTESDITRHRLTAKIVAAYNGIL